MLFSTKSLIITPDILTFTLTHNAITVCTASHAYRHSVSILKKISNAGNSTALCAVHLLERRKLELMLDIGIRLRLGSGLGLALTITIRVNGQMYHSAAPVNGRHIARQIFRRCSVVHQFLTTAALNVHNLRRNSDVILKIYVETGST